MNHVYMMHEQKPIQQIGSKHSKSSKTLKSFWFGLLKNFDEENVEEENPWSFDSEKDKFFFEWRVFEKNQREKTKLRRTCCLIPFCFPKKKEKFNQSRGIEPGIKKVLKIDLTDREESKKTKTFSLTFDWSRLEKPKNFENLEIFCRNTFKPVFMIWNACQWFHMFSKTLSLQSNQILFFLFFIKIQIFSQQFLPQTPKSIKHFKKHNLWWPQKLTHNHMYGV